MTHLSIVCAGLIDVKKRPSLLPPRQPVTVKFLSKSNALRQMRTVCGDTDACKYDLEKTKNLTLAAASKQFNVQAFKIPRVSLTDAVKAGKEMKYNPSRLNIIKAFLLMFYAQ